MEIAPWLRVIDPAELLSGMGLNFFFAVLVIPIFPLITSGYRRSRLVWVLFSVPALLVLDPLTAAPLEKAMGYMHYRLLYAAPAMVYLALAVFGAGRGALTGRWKPEGDGGGWKRRTAVRVTGAFLFFLFAALVLRPSAESLPQRLSSMLKRADRSPGLSEEAISDFFSVIPAGSVVASDPVSSYMISAFTDHYVVVILDQHCSPADTSAVERVRRSRDMFSPALSDSVVMDRILASGAGYLFIDCGPPAMEDFFGVNSQASGTEAALRFSSFPSLREIASRETMRLFAVEPGAEGLSGRAPAEDNACSGEEDMMVGGGIVLDSLPVVATCAPGDTAAMTMCWRSLGKIDFGLPLYWTVRLDTDFRKGPFYREWYGKLYRRAVERSRGELYRYTVSGRLASGARRPDMWGPGEKVSQEIRIVIPNGMSKGDYTVRVSVERRSYLPCRRLKDYFLNEDSYAGSPSGTVTIRD